MRNNKLFTNCPFYEAQILILHTSAKLIFNTSLIAVWPWRCLVKFKALIAFRINKFLRTISEIFFGGRGGGFDLNSQQSTKIVI